MTTNVPEIFYNSSLNWDLSSWLRNVYFCLGTNNKTFVHGSMTIIEITVSVMPLQNIMSFKTSLWITEIVNFTWRMWWLDIPFPEIRHAFLVFSLVRVPAACQLPLWKRSYIWKEVSKPQIVIVFPAKKKKSRVLLKPWQLCLVMEKNLQQENKAAFITIMYML